MNPCHDARLNLGVYVLGAIDPADRTHLEHHLAGCPACRDELAALAALPALLGRVTEPQVTEATTPGDDHLLTSLLARAQAEHRPRRRLPSARALALPVAAAVLLATGVVLGTALDDRPDGTAADPVVTVTTSRPGAEQLTATDPITRIRADITLWPRKGGTALSVHLDGVPDGTSCSLVAVGLDGRRDTAAGWTVTTEGYGDYRGSTMITRTDLDRLEVVTTTGRTLVTVPTS